MARIKYPPDKGTRPLLAPESLMMSYGYKPELSEGALKCPIFQTSTFVFKNAEEWFNVFGPCSPGAMFVARLLAKNKNQGDKG